MQSNPLIDMPFEEIIVELIKFKEPEYLVKEFYEEFCNLNHMEYDGTFQKLDKFEYKYWFAPPNGEIEIFSEEVNFTQFKLNKFKSKAHQFYKELSSITEAERYDACKKLNNRLKEIIKEFERFTELNQYALELINVIRTLNYKYLTDNKKTKNNSFQYKDGLKYDKINSIFQALIKENLIDEKTKLLDFQFVFQNRSINNQIIWTGSTSDLKYFILKINDEKFNFKDNKEEKWHIAVRCFSKIKKRSFEKVNSEDLRTYKVTSRTKIDKIFESIFN